MASLRPLTGALTDLKHTQISLLYWLHIMKQSVHKIHCMTFKRDTFSDTFSICWTVLRTMTQFDHSLCFWEAIHHWNITQRSVSWAQIKMCSAIGPEHIGLWWIPSQLHYTFLLTSCSTHITNTHTQISQQCSVMCVCVHAQTQLTSDSAIVRAPLPLDTARKDISNTNEGMWARLSLCLCPCQPVKPLLSNSVVQRACAKDHHYRTPPGSTAQHITRLHKRIATAESS